jgi:tetratricopeptide (TPR) repeat protein
MPEPDILRLDAYRERREQRLRLAASLYGADRGRSEILQHLVKVVSLLGADRAATVWIDEFGPGLVHPHVVLDLLSDRPRRAFAAEPLQRAWEGGVPGVFEGRGPAPRGEGLAWTVAVALGSDGTRSWFLVADAVSPSVAMGSEVRDRLMFLAGECSAVVLHRDLDAMASAEADPSARGRPRFAGWHILQDIEGREGDELESRRIAMRFVVARLPRLLVEDDLAIPRDRLRQQAQRAREEVGRDAGTLDIGQEAVLWEEVLNAFQDGDLEGLGKALLRLAGAAESRTHLHGAAELYRTAYEIFAATGQVALAVDAARFTGRALRRLAAWDEATRWYGIAREVASAGSLRAKVAMVLDGVANIHRERGNLPAARAVLYEALGYAREAGDPEALGAVFHGLAGTEHLLGNLREAVGWGWNAVEAYRFPGERVMALATLGGILIDLGDLDAATDAWSCTRDLATNDYYRIYALDALGHICALRGDGAGFARWAEAADAMGWEAGPLPAKAEILHYRGLSFMALGDPARARSYLERAVAFAEEHGFGRTLFAAEAALSGLTSPAAEKPPATTPPSAPEAVSTGLREMRLRLEVAVPG